MPLSLMECIWNVFIDWCKEHGGLQHGDSSIGEWHMDPREPQYLGYFDYLWSTNISTNNMWVIYTHLNNRHRRTYGVGLEQWPSIAHRLMGYQFPDHRPVF